MSRYIYKTDIEQMMFDALTNASIDFTFQYPLRGKYGYISDFFIPANKIIIECDGEAWHNKKRDNTRDAVLKKQGYKILRFTGTQIKEDLNSCLNKIRGNIKCSGIK